jgi:general secretion pathway protein F
MTQFRYRAVLADGQMSEGEISAGSHAEAIAAIQALGLIAVSAVPAEASWLRSLMMREIRLSRADTVKQLTGFIRQLGVLLQAGLPLDHALEVLGEAAGRKGGADVSRRLLDRVRGGSALADAMVEEALFPKFCTSMIRAGEMSGSLESVLSRLGDFLERSQATRAKIKSALMYPIIVLVACLVSLVVLFSFVVPRFRPFFEDARVELPFATQALLVVADVFEQYWWVPLLLTATTALYIVSMIKNPQRRPQWDRFTLRLPVIGGMLHKAEIAHFSRILGTLLKNGVALPNGLAIAADTIRNQFIAPAIIEVARNVTEGKGLAEPLARTGLIPPLALRLLCVGEEAARLDDMLLEVAAIFDWETETSMNRLLTAIGPALTVGLGLLVALVIGSLMMAILSVYQLAG